MSRPGFARVSYPGLEEVRVFGVHDDAKSAQAEAGGALGGYVLPVVYDDGSRAPRKGDILKMRQRSGYTYGAIVAPAECA